MLAALALTFVLAASPAAEPADPLAAFERAQEHLFEKVAPSVVFLSNREGFGSGFFISGDGLVLTCEHVVGDAKQVAVVLFDGRKLTGTVVERAQHDVDLALVQVPLTGTPALALAGDGELRVGSWVGSVGHGEGGVWAFNDGMVANIYPDGNDRPVFQTQIPLNPGSSGGPIFDRQGRVVGVVTAGMKGSNSMNFAIRSEVAYQELTRLAASAPFLTIRAPAGVPVFVDGAMAGTGPRVNVPAHPKRYEVFAVIGGKMVKKQVRFPETRAVELK